MLAYISTDVVDVSYGLEIVLVFTPFKDVFTIAYQKYKIEMTKEKYVSHTKYQSQESAAM